MGADAGAQPGKAQAVARFALGAGTGVHPAAPWPWPQLQPGKALAVVVSDRAGRRRSTGLQPGKPQDVTWPALGAGTGADAGAQPGKALAMATTSTKPKPWVQALVQRWASTRQGPGRGRRFSGASSRAYPWLNQQ